MSKGKPFNGHPSWAAWNISLWINNDEGLYRFLQDEYHNAGNKRDAAQAFLDLVPDTHTPDGARYTLTNVIRAMEGW